ncbi:hypothetical protein CIG75_06625 [Tumebacillus algifaecis]|uniref:Carrier domain-containing protein n=1 Tax=Tumebacillus algifaecis TaxID=1214604 RepID=A0A223CZZ1_9BACL|nr:non-ribosomal peptide synthetase [Tumebacillus algifaecis]ASS74677.1 hypothetical protein CIG75_06625 [Tumebacillus algifaecis]
MKDLQERIKSLSPEQRKVFEAQLKKMGIEIPQEQKEEDTIAPRGHNNPSPLSYDQERLWFFQQMEPDKSTYNVYTALRFKGVLHIDLLERAVNGIVARHEAWRTIFRMQADGSVVQIVQPNVEIKAELIDLRHLQESEREEALETEKFRESNRLFDLENGPLLRVMLVRMSDEDTVFIFSIHHLVMDRVTFSMFFHELKVNYTAYLNGEEPQYAPLQLHYADFAEYQRNTLQGAEMEKQLSYWRKHLEDSSLILNLPTDYPRLADQDYKGARHHFEIPQSLFQDLKALARQENATANMITMAAYKVLLYRYTGQPDIIIGTPLANRDKVEMENIFGYFLTTIPLRTDLAGDLPFREVLRRVKNTSFGAYDYKNTPFGLILDDIKPERDASRNPIYQAVFVYVDVPEEKFTLPGIEVDGEWIDNQTAKYDLSLAIVENDDGLSLFEYRADLFEHETIVRMAEHYMNLLYAIVDNPDKSISELAMLTDVEHTKLFKEWNVKQELSTQPTLHQLFEEQAAKRPHAVAVTEENTILTYAELNARANRLAHRLQKLGVGPESLVGLCVERSTDMVVAVLGILKAGGSYVPLDPTYPQDRLAFMLEDSAVSVLVTQSNLLTNLPAHRAQVVTLDHDAAGIAEESADNLESRATRDTLAYVIYTSGSTGTPKGVLVPHGNVVRLFSETEHWFHFHERDVWTLFHSYAFDFSVWELWGPLLSGGKLVIVPYHVTREPDAFYDLLVREGVTVLNQTPSAFRQLMLAEERVGLSPQLALRYVIFGGEALEIRSLGPWFDRHGDSKPQLINMYGITETTVHVTYRPLSGDDLASKASVIGRPIRDLQVYLFDNYGQPVPIGVPGEICVGGAGLARGYLNRQELTEDRFIQKEINGVSERLYRSGDLGRYLSNGDLEYLGRIDQQVKIRGFRIELGEIEAAVVEHPSVRSAVVIDHEDERGHKRLIGYVIPYASGAVSSQELRHYLKERLPEYMVPALFVSVETIPLTANGKVDRKKLPAPQAMVLEDAVMPTNDVEEVLAKIYAEVLRLEHVGTHDNFFDLGGDSILSIQIITRAAQEGLRLTPKDMFKYQTIAELAIVAGKAAIVKSEQGLVTGEAALTPSQEWFFEQNLLEQHYWNMPFLLEVRQRVDLDLLQAAFGELMKHHDALRMRFVKGQNGWSQFNADLSDDVPFVVIDLSHVPSDLQEAALEEAALELQSGLNLTDGPLVQFAYFNLGPEKTGRLLFAMHHLVIDGVSWRILIEDLRTAYMQLQNGQKVKLPPKTTSYRYWANRLNEYAQTATVLSEADYWLEARWHQVNALPVDQNGENIESSVDIVSVSLPKTETQQLLYDVPKAYNTQINDVLLTALAKSIANWTQQRTLLVNIEGHGREDLMEEIDHSRTVGFFTSIYPVLLDIGFDKRLGEQIKAVKEQLRAIPNKGVGYGILRHLCQVGSVAERLKSLPQADISFNYLGQFDQQVSGDAWFGFASESIGSPRAQSGSRSHSLQVSATVLSGELEVVWEFSKNLHKRETIELIAQNFLAELQALIEHCLDPNAGGFTPSDFPEANVNQQDLDKFLSSFGKVGGKE